MSIFYGDSLGNIIPGAEYYPMNLHRELVPYTSKPLTSKPLTSDVIEVPYKELASKTPFNLKDWVGKNWSKGSGIKAGNIGKMSNWGAGISEGIQAVGNLSDISQTNSNIDDLEGRILNAYGSNPLANDMLTSEQLTQIRNLQRGYDTKSTPEFGDAISGIGNNLEGILTNTLISGAVGGIPGAVISALGGLFNSGMQGYNQAQNQRASELESLYNTLLDAESQYKSMRRPTMAGLPLQQRYIDMYQ